MATTAATVLGSDKASLSRCIICDSVVETATCESVRACRGNCDVRKRRVNKTDKANNGVDCARMGCVRPKCGCACWRGFHNVRHGGNGCLKGGQKGSTLWEGQRGRAPGKVVILDGAASGSLTGVLSSAAQRQISGRRTLSASGLIGA
jgi:hypothetical protein